MDEDTSQPVKKTTRTRRTTTRAVGALVDVDTSLSSSATNKIPLNNLSSFTNLINQINDLKNEYETLQKEITQTKEGWQREQVDHQQFIAARDRQEELERKQVQELYAYETSRKHKLAEDEFTDRRLKLEKELLESKEAIEKDQRELDQLRKLVTGFEDEKEKAVKNAEDQLEANLNNEFETTKRLREQEVKAEKELLDLKIVNLTNENVRLNREIEVLKRSLDEATRQVKDIAVRVIESSSNTQKTYSLPQENKQN